MLTSDCYRLREKLYIQSTKSIELKTATFALPWVAPGNSVCFTFGLPAARNRSTMDFTRVVFVSSFPPTIPQIGKSTSPEASPVSVDEKPQGAAAKRSGDALIQFHVPVPPMLWPVI